MKKQLISSFIAVAFILICFSPCNLQGQEKKADPTGWQIGGILPAVAYDADKGFRYGALTNIYNYGDPSVYPFYKHSIYLEWSHTTKGSDLKQFKYDSEYLIPGVRLTGIVRLETEKAMDFYGFNGYESLYDNAFEVNSLEDGTSRMYYRMGFRSLRVKANFQGKIIGRKLRWFAGLAHYNIKVGSVDLDKLNKNKTGSNIYPDVPGLYEQYISQGIIPEDQKEGGFSTRIKLGLVADTRDNEPNPNKGIWTELFFIGAPGFIGNENPYTAMVLTHRQYFTLIPKYLTFAYRLNYQTSLSGNIPWYLLSFKPDTYVSWDGLGGNKTLRGIMRNRVVGEGAVLGNFELRWKFWNFMVANREVYLALSPFVDAAKITRPYENQPNITGSTDGIHYTYGAGLHIALNQNFIVAVDYGFAADKRDGDSGLYIGLDFLF